MAAEPPRRQAYTVACRCGAHAAVETRLFGQPQVCHSCKVAFTVVWKKDPRSGAAVPMAVAQARKSAPREGAAGLFLVCACGYRRAVSPEEAARNNRCPGCGKWMFVEKPPSARVVPAPPAPLPTAPRAVVQPLEPVPPETPIGARAVRCPCGERLLVRLELVGREARCPKCRQVLTLEGFRDPQTCVTQIRPVVAREGGHGPVAPLQAAQPEPQGGGAELTCPCGRQLPVTGAAAAREVTCASCGSVIPIERHRDPQTLVTTIRVRPGAPPAAVGSLTQEVICKCGEALIVGLEDAGRHVQCPSCGVLMEVEQAGGALRVREIGQMDDGTWSLEDFS